MLQVLMHVRERQSFVFLYTYSNMPQLLHPTFGAGPFPKELPLLQVLCLLLGPRLQQLVSSVPLYKVRILHPRHYPSLT